MDSREAIEKKKTIILILLIIIYTIHIFSIFGYANRYSSRYKYKNFMDEIESYSINHLNSSYIGIFQEVFGRYWDNGVLGKGIEMIIMGTVEFFIGIISIIGIILTCISLNKNKNKFAQIVLFIYTIVIGCFELYLAIFKEKNKLNLTDSQLEEFKGMRESIESNLASVKARVLFLRVYSALLIITSIINIILNIFIRKLNKKSELVNYRDDKMNNSTDGNNSNTKNNLLEE